MDDRKPLTKREIGAEAEAFACHFLQKQGLTLLEHNYSCKLGEIDLIMRHREHIVFIEVRKRIDTHYGSAIESIGPHKQQKVIRAAKWFLLEKQWYDKVYCRFDVIGVSGIQSESQLLWIQNAFLTR